MLFDAYFLRRLAEDEDDGFIIDDGFGLMDFDGLEKRKKGMSFDRVSNVFGMFGKESSKVRRGKVGIGG